MNLMFATGMNPASAIGTNRIYGTARKKSETFDTERTRTFAIESANRKSDIAKILTSGTENVNANESPTCDIENANRIFGTVKIPRSDIARPTANEKTPVTIVIESARTGIVKRSQPGTGKTKCPFAIAKDRGIETTTSSLAERRTKPMCVVIGTYTIERNLTLTTWNPTANSLSRQKEKDAPRGLRTNKLPRTSRWN
jgi:hypothetical protein